MPQIGEKVAFLFEEWGREREFYLGDVTQIKVVSGNPSEDSKVTVQIWSCDPHENNFYAAKYCRSWLDRKEQEILSVSKPSEPCKPFSVLIPARDVLVMDVASRNGFIDDADKVTISTVISNLAE